MNINRILIDVRDFTKDHENCFNLCFQTGGKGAYNFLIIEAPIMAGTEKDQEQEKKETIKFFSDMADSLNKIGHADDEEFFCHLIIRSEIRDSKQTEDCVLLKMRFSKKLPAIKVDQHAGGTTTKQVCYSSTVLDLS